MMCGAAILTGASFIMAVAPNWQSLVVGRALDGVAIGKYMLQQFENANFKFQSNAGD